MPANEFNDIKHKSRQFLDIVMQTGGGEIVKQLNQQERKSLSS